MEKLDKVTKDLLSVIADIDGEPKGAYNIRLDGQSAGRRSTENIEIIPRADGKGIEIHIKPNTIGEVCHIPVVVKADGLADKVYNDFFIGEGSDVTIVAGCGIHNDSDKKSNHDGVHTFHIGKNAKLKYTEKHYAQGNGTGSRELNPETIVHIAESGYMEMETVQIDGVDNTDRKTSGFLGDHAKLVVKEKLMTCKKQYARTEFVVDLNGVGASADVMSRSVAKENSRQIFESEINGNNQCAGHTECDAIIMGDAKVCAIPRISANHVDAALIHEAAIGKIAGEQLIKLMSLGLSEQDAEKEIVAGFLR